MRNTVFPGTTYCSPLPAQIQRGVGAILMSCWRGFLLPLLCSKGSTKTSNGMSHAFSSFIYIYHTSGILFWSGRWTVTFYVRIFLVWETCRKHRAPQRAVVKGSGWEKPQSTSELLTQPRHMTQVATNYNLNSGFWFSCYCPYCLPTSKRKKKKIKESGCTN